MPLSETFDIDQLITLTRRQTKQTKGLIKKDPNRYRWIQPHTTFDYLKPKEDKLYDLPIRIVRFKIADSVYETLYTNLPREDFPVDVLKELYRLRWGIETAFRELKYNVGIASIHSRKTAFVFQEIYAKLIMYNFSSLIAYAVGMSRQSYNSIELKKRRMTWTTYMALILLFDYNPNSHYRIRQLEVFPNQLDECWLSGKIIEAEGL